MSDFDKLLYGTEPKKKRPYENKNLIKQIHGNTCVICGKNERQVGKLVIAHVKAHSKGGSTSVPMCRNHHGKYDDGKFTNSELKKLHITRKQYKSFLPKTNKKKPKNPYAIQIGLKPLKRNPFL